MKGKTVLIILLTVIIAMALVPWYMVIARLFGDDVPVPAPVYTQAPEPEYDDEGYNDYLHDDDDDDDEYEYFEPIPPGETIMSIYEYFPDLFADLYDISSEFETAAVSMVAFDSRLGEFFTFQYGYADIDEHRAVDLETRFRVASSSKLVTAICAMILVDRGYIDLDEDISVYLGYSVTNREFPQIPITMRMLLQHTSSVFDSATYQISRDSNTEEPLGELLQSGESFRNRAPGVEFEFTNFGFAIIAGVCEAVSGMSFDELARSLLFEPLGIDAAYLASSLSDRNNIAVLYNRRHSVTQSVETQLETARSGMLGYDIHLYQGNLTISAIDYARVLAMIGNHGVYKDVRILSENAANMIHITNVQGPNYMQGLGVRFSNGGFGDGTMFYWHTGSAYGTFVQVMYTFVGEGSRGIVVLTTGANAARMDNGFLDVCSRLAQEAWHAIWSPRLISDIDEQNNYDESDAEHDSD